MAALYRYSWFLSLMLTVLAVFGQTNGEAAPRIYRDKIDPHWFAAEDGQTNMFWYRLELSGNRREFVLVNSKTGTRTAAFDQARAAETLSKMTSRKLSGDHLPIEGIRFSRNGKSAILAGPNGNWKLDLQSYSAAAVPADEMQKNAIAGHADSPWHTIHRGRDRNRIRQSPSSGGKALLD
jgi:hypothetical protein